MYFIMSKSLGTHIILDFYGCNPRSMMFVPDVQALIKEAARLAHFSVVAEEYHQFEPHGVSGMTIIEESHISMHSWAENRYASIDIFYCGNNDFVEEGINYLIKSFEPTRVERQDIMRGIPEIYNNI